MIKRISTIWSLYGKFERIYSIFGLMFIIWVTVGGTYDYVIGKWGMGFLNTVLLVIWMLNLRSIYRSNQRKRLQDAWRKYENAMYELRSYK
jgi:hypothetical protein